MEEWESRRSGTPVNEFQFGRQTVKTKVYMVMPEPVERVDVQLGDIKVRRRAPNAEPVEAPAEKDLALR
jgi:hypothetical protein